MARERRKRQEEGDFTNGYDGMPGWTSVIGLINGWKQTECLGQQRLCHIELINGSKHMECLGGMRLQSILTNRHFVYPCNAGYLS